MDADRFDAFVRALPSGPRRPVVTGLLGAGLLSLPSLLAPDAEARKRRSNKRKKKRRKKRRDQNQECLDGQQRCGKQCVDLLTDPDNCGACFNECVLDGCFNGACACETIFVDCPNDCFCTSRAPELGGAACSGGFGEAEVGFCDSDDVCPIGSVCTGLSCTDPCLS